MDTGSSGESNTLKWIAEVQQMQGKTFAEQCANALMVLDARMSRVGQGSDEWHQLLRLKGQTQGFIRFDGDSPLQKEVSESVIVLAA